ncbi:MAG TPA: hypothetical protein VM577_09340 [Anaerovoracaceae bacterium]|nr:hypothetical protein [Anaerovoracaceae bacterium]
MDNNLDNQNQNSGIPTVGDSSNNIPSITSVPPGSVPVGGKKKVNVKVAAVGVVIAGLLIAGQVHRHEREATEKKENISAALDEGSKIAKDAKQKLAAGVDGVKQSAVNGGISAVIKNNSQEVETKNDLKAVDNSKYINVTQLPDQKANVDLNMVYAINSNDPDRVNYLLRSGLTVPYTNTAVCIVRDPAVPLAAEVSRDVGGKTYVMPTDMHSMEQFIGNEYFEMKFSLNQFVTTACEQRYLNLAAKNIDKWTVPGDGFKFYNQHLFNDARSVVVGKDQQDKQEAQSRRLAIFNAFLSQTPEQDYEFFPQIVVMKNLDYNTREDVLQKYLTYYAHRDIVAKDPSRVAVEKLYTDALTDLYNTNHQNKDIGDLKWRTENMPTVLFQTITLELVNKIHDYNQHVIGFGSYFQKGQAIVIDKNIIRNGLNFSIDSQSPYYIGLQEQGYKQLYEVQQLIKMYNMLLDSKLVNINVQDAKGFTVLHELVQQGDDSAPVIRDLLARGANPTLVTQNGMTPLNMAYTNSSKVNSNTSMTLGIGNDEVIKAFTDKQ